MTKTRLTAALIAITTAAACGGGTHVDGNLGGHSFVAAEAVSAVWTQKANGTQTTSAAILITTEARVCDVIAGGHAPRGAQSLMLSLTDVDGKTGAVTAPSGSGVYTVVGKSGQVQAHTAGVAWVSLDQTCGKAAQANGVSGTVTLSTASASGYAGSFDLTLDSGDHVSGHFDSTSCGALAAELDDMTELPCGP